MAAHPERCFDDNRDVNIIYEFVIDRPDSGMGERWRLRAGK